MYVLRDKKTKATIHINPAPLSQELDGAAVYHQYNSKTMEIGKTDLNELPEHFTIDSDQQIRELSLEEKVKGGILQLGAHQKVMNNQIVEKTVSEKVRDGLCSLDPAQKVTGSGAEERIVDKTPSELVAEKLLKLTPHQKIVGEGTEERIVDKTPSELVTEKLLKLTPYQKIVGQGAEEKVVDKTPAELAEEKLIELSPWQKITGEGTEKRIVDKTPAELARDGLLQLGPYQGIEDDQIVTYTNEEMLAKGLIKLTEYKSRLINYYSDLAFRLREEVIPTYRITNATLGIYDESETNNIKATIQAFRDEFYRLQKQVEKAKDFKAITAIKENFPRQMINSQK